MFRFKTWACVALASATVGSDTSGIADQPNVLWILTDDQRYDSIRAFNKLLHGREMSELGYVESFAVTLPSGRTTRISSFK